VRAESAFTLHANFELLAMKKTILSFASLAFLVTVFAMTLPMNWAIGEKYSIAFSTSGVSGIFKTFTGSINFDEQNLAASRFDVSIDVNSINTGNGMQNKHAKSSDWFDAAKYPAIKFTSKKFVKSGAAYQVTGDLQMHGITKELTVPFQFKKSGAGAVFTGTFKVNRNDFRIGDAGGEVGDVVNLTVSVPVVKK
jgi:polyisoprenoid-binding protein YceI